MMIGLYTGAGTHIRGYQTQSGRVQEVGVVTFSKSAIREPKITVEESSLAPPASASQLELDLLGNVRTQLQSEIAAAQALLDGQGDAELTSEAQAVWDRGGEKALAAYVETLSKAETFLGKQQEFRQSMFDAESEAADQMLLEQALGDRAELMMATEDGSAEWGRQRALLRLFAMTGQDSDSAMAFLEKGKALARAGQKAALVEGMKEQIADGELNVSISRETAWAHQAVGVERVEAKGQVSMVYNKEHMHSVSAYALSAGLSGSYSRTL